MAAAESIGAWLSENIKPAPDVVLMRSTTRQGGRLDAILVLIPRFAADDRLVDPALWHLVDSGMRIFAVGDTAEALERAAGWRVRFHDQWVMRLADGPGEEVDDRIMREIGRVLEAGGRSASGAAPQASVPMDTVSPEGEPSDIPEFPGRMARPVPEPGPDDRSEIAKFLRRQADARDDPPAAPARLAPAESTLEPETTALLDEWRRTFVEAARPPRAPSSIDRPRVLASAARPAALERRARETSVDAAMRRRRENAEREMSSSRPAAPPESRPPGSPPHPQAAERAAPSAPDPDWPEPSDRAYAPRYSKEYIRVPEKARSTRRKLSGPLLLGVAAVAGIAVVGMTTGVVEKLLAALAGYLGVTPVMPGVRPAEPETGEDVDLSLFSRPSVGRGTQVLVQALLHLHEAIDVTPTALMADPGAKLKARRSLLLPLATGDRVDLVIAVPGCGIEEPRETVIWRRQTTTAGFLIDVPADFAGDAVHVSVNAFRNGEPLGRIAFAMPVAAATGEPEMRVMGDEARRFSHAFVSYASVDRPIVIRYAHAWSVMRQSYFQDFLSLQPGDAWQARLVEEIDRSDVLVLFWSQAASRSDHVRREVEYALERRKAGQAIEILPVIIDGPPPAAPPESLSSIHFNDRHAYVVASVIAEAALRPPH